jgi:hypothetical protein
MDINVIVLGTLPPKADSQNRSKGTKRPFNETKRKNLNVRFSLRVELGWTVHQLKKAIDLQLQKELQLDMTFDPEVQYIAVNGSLIADTDTIGSAFRDVRKAVCALDFPKPSYQPCPAPVPSVVDMGQMNQLACMGFPAPSAKKALEICGNNIERAVLLLTENIALEAAQLETPDDTYKRLAETAENSPYLLMTEIQNCSLDHVQNISIDRILAAMDAREHMDNPLSEEKTIEPGSFGGEDCKSPECLIPLVETNKNLDESGLLRVKGYESDKDYHLIIL